jgi:predicted O-linked N-acetylglucosamine transferase (SPINDLY family)
LIAELFELHDRAQFEITGVSYGPDKSSEMRTRLIRSFDRFLDVRFKTDEEVDGLLRELEIDIAVDLKGHTKDGRLAILAHRPAPVQVSYLGFQGTTGAEFIDYVIGDEIALPSGLQPFFTEKIVHLPVSHQVNDSTRKIPALSLSRSQIGLPENGFVFCNFNDSNKLTPAFFDIWMRLLGAVGGSVLWLVADSDRSRANLRREAEARSVDPARLVFAKWASLGEHLFRHRLANLYLDTLPVCAHTSASRTLWAGLPILTCAGEAFSGRITASMLNAIGLPELVARSLEEYEALAVKLATDAALLEGIRRKLEENRRTSSLFDTGRFRRHLEKAYRIMWERSQRGEPPSSFAVDPIH